MSSAGAFTLVELMIGMVLLVMILVAAALAMQGAANASEYGADKAVSLQQTSLTLRRISADLRQAETVLMPEAGCLDLVMPDGQWRRYRWVPSADGGPLTFYSDRNPDGNVLIPDVSNFLVQTVWGWSDVKEEMAPLCVRIILEGRHGSATTRLDSAVRPRRNIL